MKKKINGEHVGLTKQRVYSDGLLNVRAGRVRKSSLLHEHPNFVVKGALCLKHLHGNEDLCVVKSFVSVLHCIGLEKEADKIVGQHEMHKSTAVTKATSMETAVEIARQVLPKTFECKQCRPGEFNHTKMKKHCAFLDCIETSDGHTNHAVTLFQDHMFDSNEKTALHLYKEGKDCCLNNGTNTVKCKQFARGCLIKCTLQGWKNTFARLKKTREKICVKHH